MDTVAISKLNPAKDNPRGSIGDVTELAASIKAVGILEPLVVTPNGKGYAVVAGTRRLAAARKAGLKEVPVVVREFTDAQRAEAMLIENLQRTDLTPLEEASAFQVLVQTHGYSQRKIAERIGRNQSHVSKRLQLLQLTEKARKALDAGRISIEEGLELTKLAEHPERMDRLTTGGRVSGWEIRRELEDVELERKRAAATAKLQAGGTKIVGVESGRYSDVRLAGSAVQVTEGYSYAPHVRMSPAKHATQPCHAAAIGPDDAKVLEVCTSPKIHGKLYVGAGGSNAPSKGGLSDKEKTARKAKREHNAALREAEARRWEFLRWGFGQRLTSSQKDPALRLLVDAWAHRELGVPYQKVGVSASELLGLEVKGGQYTGPDHRAAIAQHLAKKPEALLRVALAVGIGAVEDGIRPGVGYSGPFAWVAARPYFAWLEELGYEVSDAEKLELAGKAPK